MVIELVMSKKIAISINICGAMFPGVNETDSEGMHVAEF